MRACALVQLAVCGVLLACCLSSSAVSVSAQVIPSPLTPTDDSITNLVYAFTLNGTGLANGTIDAWNPIYCASLGNGASIELQSRTSPAVDKPDTHLQYLLTAQGFLYSSNCTGRPLPRQTGPSGEVPNQPSNGALVPFNFHSFAEPELNGLTIVGSLNVEIPERSSSSSSSSTGPGPIPPPEPAHEWLWTLHYNYTFAEQTVSGTHHGDSFCAAIAGNFSLLYTARASIEPNHTAVLLNNTLHWFPNSLDCTGEAHFAESQFDVVADEIGTTSKPFIADYADLPAGLIVSNSYDFTVAPAAPVSSSSTGPAPESSSTGPAPEPEHEFLWTLIYNYTYAGQSVVGTQVGDAPLCTAIANNFSLQWVAVATVEPLKQELVYLNNTLYYFPHSLECAGEKRVAGQDVFAVTDEYNTYTRTWSKYADLPAGLLVSNSYVFTIAPVAPVSSSTGFVSSSSGAPGPDDHHGGGMSKGTKTLLIVLGSVAGALALVAIFCCACKKKKVEQTHNNQGHYQTMAH